MSDAQVQLTIDGKKISCDPGTTIFDAARMNGIPIPTLCHQQNERPVGVCRVCVVDVKGARVLAASCVRAAENNMEVNTNNERVAKARHTLVEMLMADHPSPCARQRHSGDCELETLAAREGVTTLRYPRRVSPRGQDDSSLSIAVDHEACILCDRCMRGCDEIKSNFVIGRHGKGYKAGIAFDNNSPMGNSSCVSCGECMTDCPTGALTNKSTVRSTIPGEEIDVEELLALPYFEKVSGTFLELNKHSVVKRRFRAGDVICREGEYGSTAFYILEGSAKVFVNTPMAHIKTHDSSTSWLKKLTSTLSKRTPEMRHGIDEERVRSIPIDAPMDLPLDHPVAELAKGDLFGEMTCMSLYPRSATVVASTDCVMLEMLRNILDIIQRNKTLRAQLDEKYRSRALQDHLRSVPMFAELDDAFIDVLRKRVELVRYSKGDVIVRQGDVADAFYLVRIGFVKVTELHPGGDLVLAYLGRGGYFGEIGLLGGGLRTATVTALDHAEVVRIHAEEFQQMIDKYPRIKQSLIKVAHDRTEANEKRLETAVSMPLDSFLTQGLMEAQSLLVLDLEKCTRCDQCTRACADAHDGVTRLIREGLRYDKYLVATSCRQCRDPLCMVGCPVGSIRRRNSLEVVIEDWCVGCGLCAKNCPYGNISMHPIPGTGQDKAKVNYKATSCDLCTDLAEPSCVYACPHDAAHRVEPNEFFKWLGPDAFTEARR